MGRPKLIYFTDELFERLKLEKNASKLISDLLLEHYKKIEFEGLTTEEMKTEREIILLKQETDKKIKEMRNANR